MAYRDMRAFLAALEKVGQLKRIEVPFDVARGSNELQALMRHLAETDGPALVLQNLEGYNTPGVPLIFNPYGTRERTAMILGTRDPLEAKVKHFEVLQDPSKWIKPTMVPRGEAPCKEVVIPRDQISVDRHIPHVFFGREGASYITGAVVVTRDPESGSRNVGAYRLTSFWNCLHPHDGSYTEQQQKKQLSIFAFWNPPMNHIGLHLARAQKLGRPLEIAVACQVDPALHLACATGTPGCAWCAV